METETFTKGAHPMNSQQPQGYERTDAMMYDGSDTHPSLTCSNAGGGQRMPDKENFNGIIEMETETFTNGAHPMNAHQPRPSPTPAPDECGTDDTVILNFKADLAGGNPETAMVTGGHDSRSTDFTNLITSQSGTKPRYRYAVRRITPIEGERLQGFADNWTRPCFAHSQITDELVDRFIGIHQNWSAINGKPNAKPKSRKWVRNWLLKISGAKCPDGPRYKAIGNSMSVNVMNWIGQRIQMEEKNSNGN